jgi:hypothetical protein
MIPPPKKLSTMKVMTIERLSKREAMKATREPRNTGKYFGRSINRADILRDLG